MSESLRLSWEERRKWGECPVCRAPHGEPCFSDLVEGRTSLAGAHLARLHLAPEFIADDPDQEEIDRWKGEGGRPE